MFLPLFSGNINISFAFFVDKIMKISELYKQVKLKFLNNGIDEHDANALFDYFFNNNELWLGLKNNNVDINKKTKNKIIKICNKRISTCEPLYSIIGYSPFYSRFFKTNRHVLKPRLDTELLVAETLKYSNSNSNILDLCCGTGILGLTLNLETHANVTCSDISKYAIKLTKQNAKKLNSKVKTIKSNMFNNIKNKFDIIVCNPPYIKTGDIKNLDVEVKNFDPHLALDGGLDGLHFYRQIKNNFENYLNPLGTLLLEIGYNQGKQIKSLFSNYNVVIKKDFNNLDRIAIIKLKG